MAVLLNFKMYDGQCARLGQLAHEIGQASS